MRSTRRGFALLAAVSLGVFAAFHGSQMARAQSATSGLDPTELLKNLSPEQQQAILERLGVGAGAGTSSSQRAGQTGVPPEQQTEQAQAQAQRPREGEELEPLIPVLKPDDWVIIEIDFQLPPRPISPSMQALQSLYLPQGGLANPQALQALQAANATGGAAGMPPGSGNVPGGAAAAVPNPAAQLSEEEKGRLQELMNLIRSKNPYRLSHDGALTLPGFSPIDLLGLTDEQGTLRLKAEPAFRDVDIRITRLPLKKTGAEALKPFGYDLFSKAPSTFAPVTNIPVPSDYIVGPGDLLDIQLYGNQNRALRLVVGRDGRINFPELGPINVGSQLFTRVKESIESRVERQMIGVRASVSMGDTRSIRVFVLGEASRPGSYTISGLGTITSALFAAGGVKPIGSLRKIELKRQGAVVRRLDLYDLLIHGDTTDDTQLLQGDVIFIPPVGPTVGVDGEVRRPAIYEIRDESNVASVIQLAGGLTPEADATRGLVTRIDESEHRIVLQVDLSASGAKSQGLRNGDILRITRLRPTLDSAVVLEGHVFTSGAFAYRQGMRLSDIVHSVDDLRPAADIHYVLIRRELSPNRRVAVLSADLAAALKSPGSAADVELMPRDRVTVFDLSSGRDRIIRPLLDELRMQSSADRPAELVHVDGRVKVPGEYPLESGMTIADLVRAGGGLADAAASGGKAELTRYTVDKGQTRQTDLIEIDVGAALRGDPSANLQLQAFDILSVKQVSRWDAQESIALMGEVRFPGRYTIKAGETLTSVIARAGGLTEYAFAEGSVFTREELRRREQEQMDALATRMQTELTALAVRGAAAGQGGAANALSVGQSLLGQLRAQKAVGRLVIDLPRLVKTGRGSPDDVILRNGDQLIIPKFQQQVTVIGEVQSATSHLYVRELARDDYISLSGGVTRLADRSKIYVVRANGSVVANSGRRWFQQSNVTIHPGDTIVVPLDAQKMPALPFWQALTSILYNVALGAAAIRVL